MGATWRDFRAWLAARLVRRRSTCDRCGELILRGPPHRTAINGWPVHPECKAEADAVEWQWREQL